MQQLFKPYTFQKCGVSVPNRIALAPMTNQQSHPDGSVSQDEYKWLVRRAKEGFGLVITCASHVSTDGKGWPGEMGIHSDEMLPGLKHLTEGIRQHRVLSVVQLFHGGARSPQQLIGVQPWSASAHIYQAGRQEVQVRAATKQDIEGVIIAFREAALRAARAGFDGVELHGAHGYLLHQFLSTATNQRTDQWGGSFKNRSRLLRTILKEVRDVVPAGFILGVRISPEDKYTFKGIDFDDSLQLAALLADEGADYIHVSPWEASKVPDKYPDSGKPLVTWFRDALPGHTALMAAGDILTGEDAVKILDYGADFIALGRVAIGVPSWPTGVRTPGFAPMMPPYSVGHLRNADLGDAFIEYMRRWKGFVEEG